MKKYKHSRIKTAEFFRKTLGIDTLAEKRFIEYFLALADKPKTNYCQVGEPPKPCKGVTTTNATKETYYDLSDKPKEECKVDSVILKNAEWLENLGVVLNFYRRIGRYDKKWIARLGNPTCLDVIKLEAETLPKLLSMIEDELFAVRNPNYMDKGGRSRALTGNVSAVKDGIPSTNVHPTPLNTKPEIERVVDECKTIDLWIKQLWKKQCELIDQVNLLSTKDKEIDK